MPDCAAPHAGRFNAINVNIHNVLQHSMDSENPHQADKKSFRWRTKECGAIKTAAYLLAGLSLADNAFDVPRDFVAEHVGRDGGWRS